MIALTLTAAVAAAFLAHTAVNFAGNYLRGRCAARMAPDHVTAEVRRATETSRAWERTRAEATPLSWRRP